MSDEVEAAPDAPRRGRPPGGAKRNYTVMRAVWLEDGLRVDVGSPLKMTPEEADDYVKSGVLVRDND